MVESERAIAMLLNELIQLDAEAITAYDEAIEKLDEGDSRSRLREFRCEHERHTVELAQLVRDQGGEPAMNGEAGRFVSRVPLAFDALSGDEAVLERMMSHEGRTGERYEKALAQPGLPPEVVECLSRHLSEERLHRAWIEERLARR